jgi:hypothetical protein
MGQYDKAVATAQRLIAKYGQDVVWHQLTNGATTPPADWKPAANQATTYTVRAVFLPTNRVNNELLRMLGNTEVPVGNTTALIAVGAFTPTLRDKLVRDGVAYAPKSIDCLAPNGQKIYYTIGLDL